MDNYLEFLPNEIITNILIYLSYENLKILFRIDQLNPIKSLLFEKSFWIDKLKHDNIEEYIPYMGQLSGEYILQYLAFININDRLESRDLKPRIIVINIFKIFEIVKTYDLLVIAKIVLENTTHVFIKNFDDGYKYSTDKDGLNIVVILPSKQSKELIIKSILAQAYLGPL